MALSKFNAYMDLVKEWLDPALVWASEHPRLATGALASTLAVLYCIKKRLTAPNLPPGPPAYPIVGSLPSLTEKFHLDIARFKETYGDVFTIWFGSSPIVVLASYTALKEVFLTRGEEFADRPPNPTFMQGLQDEFSSVPYGETWVKNKKFVVTNLRTLGGLKAGADGSIVAEIAEVLKDLRDTNQQPTDFKDLSLLATSNIMSGILFNKHLAHDDPKLHELRDMVTHFYSILNEFSVVDIFLPSWVAALLTRDKHRRINAALQRFEDYMAQTVAEHQETFDPDHLRDFVDIYIKKPDTDLGKPLYHTISLLLPDSVDSASLYMRWTVLYLGHNPDVQKKVQDEIDQLVGESQMVTIADKPKLKYTEATMYEIFRISDCSIGTGFRRPLAEGGATFRGYDIPKYAAVFGSIYNIHKDPELFPDPEKFDPERFLDETGAVVNTQYVIPFSLGRRMCVGENLVKTELFVFLANLLHMFTIKFPEDQPNPSVVPAGGMIQYPEDFKAIFVPRN